MTRRLLIAGGGLAGGLIALTLNARRPDVRVTLVEAGPQIGGNHIWSFFDSDVTADQRAVLAPLVAHRWAGHEVRFPGFRRTLGDGYNSIPSERLDSAVRAALPAERILTGKGIAGLDPGGATLDDGSRIEADGVIDARGFRDAGSMELGWQKFLGRLLRLERPHGLTRPTIMDATVEQVDGYRFVYLLPFDEDRIFVEDTYYSNDPVLDRAVLAARIDAYTAGRGWTVCEVEREEAAALPIAMSGDFDGLWRSGGAGVAKAGMAAGLFQPMTGYSLPDAMRTASFVAALPDLGSAALEPALRRFARARWGERGFYRMLARMLFRAADPDQRWRVLQRFYSLDEGLIGRFYAGRSTMLDKARVLAGRPPVPLMRAVKALRP